MSEGIEVKKILDARGSFCPGPLMELIRALKSMETNEVVEIYSEDQGSVKDIPTWVEKAGHKFLELKDYGEYYGFVVQKGEKKSRRKRK